MKTHYGNSCIHCGVGHDDVPVGPCAGTSPAIPIAYASTGVRWDGFEGFVIRYSDNRVEQRVCHVSMQAPFYHFGYSKELRHPPAYDAALAAWDGEDD